ncbi:MAG TPA: hypothetical protein VNE16_16030 [Vicinamibacterales bacterium]|nr:hypothetical protein [Vicinamibacterales bacterium]
MIHHVSLRRLSGWTHPGTDGNIAHAGAPAQAISKLRVTGKTCHLLAISLAAWVGSKVVGVLRDLLQAGSVGPAQGLASLVDVLACVLTLAVALVAILLFAVLEGIAFTATVEDEPASEALRRREWTLALWCAAPLGLVLLGLALANAWATW